MITERAVLDDLRRLCCSYPVRPKCADHVAVFRLLVQRGWAYRDETGAYWPRAAGLEAHRRYVA